MLECLFVRLVISRQEKHVRVKTNKNQSQTYYFDIEKCKVCPMREGCYKEGAKSKTYSVTIMSDTHAEQEEAISRKSLQHRSEE